MSGADATYRHWLELRLGQSLVDDLMSPDQAVAWHELCRALIELLLAPKECRKCPVQSGAQTPVVCGRGEAR